MFARRAVLLVLLALVLTACFVTGLSGPGNVAIGQSATYDVTFEASDAGTNGTAFVWMDVPTGWTVTAATYDANVNGSNTSGNATQNVPVIGSPCVLAPSIAEGYQRVGFSATFPTVQDGDTGTLHVTFTIGGAAGSYTLRSFGAGSYGGPASACNANIVETLPVTVTVTPTLATPAVAKSFSPSTITAGGTSALTITLTNANTSAITGVAFTDTYPAGLVNASPVNAATTCGGSVSSTANSVSLSAGTIPASGSCTVTINVTAAGQGNYANDIPVGAVTSTNAGANSAAGNATLVVNPVSAVAAPAVAKSFGPSTILPGGTSTLTITLTNANAQAMTGVAFTDTYPAGVVNASPANAATTCGGTVSSTATSVSLASGTIPANGSCTVSINVTATTAGSYQNDIPIGGVSSTNAGSNTTAARGTLAVAAATLSAIPTLGEYALMLMAALFGMVAVVRLRA